jgi:glycosyltransferase involved in cell wall biosynthesis
VIRVVHLSTAHGRCEIRVHLKECNSLASAGYEVHYVVADGLGDQRYGGVQVHDIGAAGGRLRRMLMRPWRMLAAAQKLQARVYHFHDPEILLVALFLLRGGAKVVYDSHEDVPRSLLSRDWIPVLIRPTLSVIFERFENFVSRRLSGIVGATPYITARFLSLNPMAKAINNYPLPSDIEGAVPRIDGARAVCYLGAISRIRGIEEMVRALEYVNAKLILAGKFEDRAIEQAVRALPGWSKVDYRGIVSRSSVRRIMAESSAGLIVYHPEPNHVDAQPNKMFEYMAAGMPVIASNFPLWREIIEGNNFGLCVDPLDPQAIASAIDDLISKPQKSRVMGENGRRAVMNRYNWKAEEEKLLEFYSELVAVK